MILLLFFIYFADMSHDIAEGLHDVDADKKHGIKTFTTSFGMKKAAIIMFLMFV